MKCQHESFSGKHILPVLRVSDMGWSKIKWDKFMWCPLLRILVLPQIADISRTCCFSFILWLDHYIHYRWVVCPAHNDEGSTAVSSGSCFSFFNSLCGCPLLVEKASYMHLQDSSVRFVAEQF